MDTQLGITFPVMHTCLITGTSPTYTSMTCNIPNAIQLFTLELHTMNTNTPTYALCPSDDIYRRCPGSGWTIYDEHFSLYKSQDLTSRWDVVDAELWF